MNEKTTPYFAFDMGYSINTDSHSEGGFLWSILMGLNLNVSKNFSMHLGVGYDLQKLGWWDWNIYYPVPGGAIRTIESDSDMSGAVLFNLGCSF